MTFDEFKAKYPDLNWKEAEDEDLHGDEDLQAAAEMFDRLVEKRKEQNK